MSINGCGGQLCMALMNDSKKFECARYATNEFGQINRNKELTTYRICGRISCKMSKSALGQIDIPGKHCGGRKMSYELLVIMSTDDVLEGDIIIDEDETQYRVDGQIFKHPATFSLEKIGAEG